jgi:hypothetical protein
MKAIKFITLFFILALAIFLAIPGQAYAAPLHGVAQSQTYSDKVVFGDTFTLSSGDVIDGSLTILGGTVSLETGSQVRGDVVLFGGTLNANGDITGNVSTLGGTLFLGDTAVVQGNLSMLGGTLHRSALAQIKGEVVNGGINPFNLNLPNLANLPFQLNIASGFQPFFNFFRSLLNTVIMAALAMLVVLLWPRPTDRIAHAIGAQPLVTGGIGLLTILVVPALLIILMITIILIPASIIGLLALGIAVLYGWFAIGLELGKRIAQMFKQEWQPAISAGLGTLVITFIASFIGAIPCVGWLIPFLIAVAGLGGVIITRLGTQIYPSNFQPGSIITPGSPAPYIEPQPPTSSGNSMDATGNQPADTPQV